MKSTWVLAVLLLLVVSSSFVWAREATASRVTGRATVVSAQTDSTAAVFPAAVRVQKPLRDIQVSYAAVETSRLAEREKYNVMKEKLFSVAQSERELLLAQLSEQRHRVLLTTLNSMTVIYQRVDYVVEKLDTSLIALRARYAQSGKNIPDFEARMDNLEQSLDSLKVQSENLALQLEKAPSSVELGVELRSIKSNLSLLIRNLKSFMQEYSILAQAVLSS